MSRYDFNASELDKGDQILDSGYRRSAMMHDDQPRRSPIRRKNNLRLNEEMRPKAKRNHKKIQYKIKYDWQGE